MTGTKVKPGSLLRTDFGAGQLQATAVAASGVLKPAASPNGFVAASASVTTTRTSDVLVQGDIHPLLTCTGAGSCEIDVGLYVDGKPTAGSLRQLTAASSGSADRLFVMYGVAIGVPRGHHTIAIKANVKSNVDANNTGFSSPGPQVAAAALTP